ncbi:MAG: helix-turn-helix transcriptional regulator [Clostridia bacterium]|nr:helix-turn-helix transcriptional regulator [Clostridia bacterium]
MNKVYSLFDGNVERMILYALLESDKYSAEISDEILKQTDNKCIIKTATLYTYLKKLESKKLLEAFWGEESRGGRRRYYKLTESGTRQICDFLTMNKLDIPDKKEGSIVNSSTYEDFQKIEISSKRSASPYDRLISEDVMNEDDDIEALLAQAESRKLRNSDEDLDKLLSEAESGVIESRTKNDSKSELQPKKQSAEQISLFDQSDANRMNPEQEKHYEAIYSVSKDKRADRPMPTNYMDVKYMFSGNKAPTVKSDYLEKTERKAVEQTDQLSHEEAMNELFMGKKSVTDYERKEAFTIQPYASDEEAILAPKEAIKAEDSVEESDTDTALLTSDREYEGIFSKRVMEMNLSELEREFASRRIKVKLYKHIGAPPKTEITVRKQNMVVSLLTTSFVFIELAVLFALNYFCNWGGSVNALLYIGLAFCALPIVSLIAVIVSPNKRAPVKGRTAVLAITCVIIFVVALLILFVMNLLLIKPDFSVAKDFFEWMLLPICSILSVPVWFVLSGITTKHYLV